MGIGWKIILSFMAGQWIIINFLITMALYSYIEKHKPRS